MDGPWQRSAVRRQAINRSPVYAQRRPARTAVVAMHVVANGEAHERRRLGRRAVDVNC